MFGLVVETLVVIMDRDREHLLGVVLADDIIVKNFAYFFGGRNAIARLHQGGFILLADDVHAQLDALVADEYGRAAMSLRTSCWLLPQNVQWSGFLVSPLLTLFISEPDKIQVITAVTPQAKPGSHTVNYPSARKGGGAPRLINYRGSF